MGPIGYPKISETTYQRCAISQESEDLATALPSSHYTVPPIKRKVCIQIIIKLPTNQSV